MIKLDDEYAEKCHLDTEKLGREYANNVDLETSKTST